MGALQSRRIYKLSLAPLGVPWRFVSLRYSARDVLALMPDAVAAAVAADGRVLFLLEDSLTSCDASLGSKTVGLCCRDCFHSAVTCDMLGCQADLDDTDDDDNLDESGDEGH